MSLFGQQGLQSEAYQLQLIGEVLALSIAINYDNRKNMKKILKDFIGEEKVWFPFCDISIKGRILFQCTYRFYLQNFIHIPTVTFYKQHPVNFTLNAYEDKRNVMPETSLKNIVGSHEALSRSKCF